MLAIVKSPTFFFSKTLKQSIRQSFTPVKILLCVVFDLSCFTRALKTKHDTPKYGLIYHASLVGQTTSKNKGKVSICFIQHCSIQPTAYAYFVTTDLSDVSS